MVMSRHDGTSVSSTRRRSNRTGQTLILLLLVLGLGLLTPTAQASPVYTSWKCAPAGCKYAQARVRYDRQIKYWYAAYWRGGTATGSCDPTGTNNVIKWRLSEIKALSGLSYTYGPTSWHYNCNVYASTWGTGVNRFWSGGLDIRYKFFHDVACSGCDFTSYIYIYG